MVCLSGEGSQAGKPSSVLGACLSGRPLRGTMSSVETIRLYMEEGRPRERGEAFDTLVSTDSHANDLSGL